MSISYAAGMSHAPGITAFPDAPPEDQRMRYHAAMQEAKVALERAKPDVLVVVAPDHFTNFFVDNMPAFCIGLNERYNGPVEDWIRVEKRVVPGAREAAKDILATCFASEIELAFSESLRLEHSVMVPLSILIPKTDIPVIWIMLNCQVPPLPSLRRCHELGFTLRKVFDRRPERFALIGTGGLSHWPGAPEGGDIDESFDREFLEALGKDDPHAPLGLSNERIDRAGFGAWEVRPWLTVRGAVPERRGRTLTYVAAKAWETGCAVMLFQ